MSDRVSKGWGASTLKVVKSRECFVEVYIDNQCLIVIIKSKNTIEIFVQET